MLSQSGVMSFKLENANALNFVLSAGTVTVSVTVTGTSVLAGTLKLKIYVLVNQYVLGK